MFVGKIINSLALSGSLGLWECGDSEAPGSVSAPSGSGLWRFSDLAPWVIKLSVYASPLCESFNY